MSVKIKVGIREQCFELAKKILKKKEDELKPKKQKNWVSIKVSWAEYSNLKKEILDSNMYINED